MPGVLFILIVPLFLIISVLGAQEEVVDFPALKGLYLGQKPPGMTPELFAPGIVSVDKFSEFVCMFAPGGEECIFDRYGDDEFPKGAVFTTRPGGVCPAPHPVQRRRNHVQGQ